MEFCQSEKVGTLRLYPETRNLTLKLVIEGPNKLYNGPGFPLRLENLEKWEGIFQSGKSQGILNRQEKSGKITQNTEKFREFQTNLVSIF